MSAPVVLILAAGRGERFLASGGNTIKKSLIALKGNGPYPTAIWKQKQPGWALDWPMFLLNWSRMI